MRAGVSIYIHDSAWMRVVDVECLCFVYSDLSLKYFSFRRILSVTLITNSAP